MLGTRSNHWQIGLDPPSVDLGWHAYNGSGTVLMCLLVHVYRLDSGILYLILFTDGFTD